ncbi:MAG: DUF4054 domain-containing protein [Lachnospiraceae bacterium]|jgi:hypothetical protein|nr:DUF4054 domain-containing protein [Lachnospiraceae bacterium]
MWPTGYHNPALPHFMGAKTDAANVPWSGECGNYTKEMFLQDFPQFTKTIPPQDEGGENTVIGLVPGAMLETFMAQANDSVLPSRWGSMWRYAVGLYVAHFASLYLKTYASGSDSPAQAAGRADQVGAVKSAAMGDTSISYDNSAVIAGTEKWGAWNATQYGSQLVTMARMVGMGGMLVL